MKNSLPEEQDAADLSILLTKIVAFFIMSGR
jgi:hypothetical protein